MIKKYVAANAGHLLMAAFVLAFACCLGAPSPGSVSILFALATLQLGTTVRNSMLDAIETAIGVSPIIELRTGALPANCAAVSTGSLLSRDAIPSDWMAAASGGTKAKAGTSTLTGAANITTQNIGYFRIYEASSPDVCHCQGDVTATGGGGAMTVDNISLAAGQVVTVNSFTLTAPNA